MTTGPRQTNDFCWINVMTPKGAEAKAFFATVFGWTYGPMPDAPGGAIILVDGKSAGALMDLDEALLPEGTPPSIGLMIRVDDAEATAKRIDALGGKAMPTFAVGTNGKMTMFADPNGAQLALWQPIDKGTMEADSHAHGAPTWFETITRDPKKAATFYAALFGWTVVETPMPEMTYTIFEQDGRPVGGAMPVLPRMGAMPSSWWTYFDVTDAAESLAVATRAGAEMLLPVTEIPDVGRFALIKSPQGVVLYILEHDAD